MARDAAEVVVVASSGDGDRVIPGRVGSLRGRGVARLVLRVRHLHHVVELGIVLEHWEIELRSDINTLPNIYYSCAKKDSVT